MIRISATLLLLAVCISMIAQQNSTLFLMPYTPQANFVNPAITNDCKLIIGIPVLSSIHANAGNSGFSFNQALKRQSDTSYIFDGNSVMRRLGKVSYFDTELHTNLLFVGYWYRRSFLTFSINEKADMLLTYPKDLFAIAWKGNSQFEGEIAKLGRTGAFMNYRREFALGIARQTKKGLRWGARAKLLFGKLNTTVTRSKMDLYTEPLTYDLTFYSDWTIKTSLPLTVTTNPSGTVRTTEWKDPSAGEILLNRSNVGFSADLGFVNDLGNGITISGSILDLGFISWKTDGYSFSQKGEYTYSGPLGDSIDNEDYMENLSRILQEEFGITARQSSYTQLMSPRVYLGANYDLGNNLSAGLVGTAKINRLKTPAGITLSLNKQFSEKFTGSVSYSYLFRDFRNLGLGIKVGKSSLQFYFVTDNIIGFVNPYGARNVNLRFGLHLNFGCDKNEAFGGCGCSGMDNAAAHREHLKKLLRKK